MDTLLNMTALKIASRNGAIGARIEGLDRSTAQQPEIAAALNRALAECLLLENPGKVMSTAEMRDFASAFGHPVRLLLRYKRSDDVPEVSVIVSTLMDDGTTDKTALRAQDWHTDDS